MFTLHLLTDREEKQNQEKRKVKEGDGKYRERGRRETCGGNEERREKLRKIGISRCIFSRYLGFSLVPSVSPFS